MSDYIKREDALNASKIIFLECIELDDEGYEEADCDDIPVVLKRDIEKIPAADVREVKRGHWKARKNWSLYVCSSCSFEAEKTSRFCPNCGAEMEETE